MHASVTQKTTFLLPSLFSHVLLASPRAYCSRDEKAREAAAGEKAWAKCTKKVDEAERAAAKSSEEGKANAAKAKKLKAARAKLDAALQVREPALHLQT